VPSNYWIKLYHEILDDPKMGQLPDHLWRRCIELFLIAGDYHEEGRLPDVADMAWRLRSNAEEVTDTLQTLAGVGIVSQNGQGWIVTKFAERQAAVPVKKRVEQFREAKRKERYYGGEMETETEREGNADVTDRYTDTDTDTDTRSKRRSVFSALAEICAIDTRTMTNSQRGMLNQAEKRLRQARASPDMIHDFTEWWLKHDWRGQKGQAPQPHQVREEWGRFTAWRDGQNSKTKWIDQPT